MRQYQIYGFVVESPYPLAPEWQGGVSNPEVRGVRGTAADFSVLQETLHGPSGESAWFHHARLADGSDYLRWGSLFECLIAPDGRQIIARPGAAVSQETLTAYLLTQALSFALLRRGVEPLHATAVVLGGKAVAFLGDCGYGKSTLAAACVQAGYPLLTDDLLLLKEEQGQLLVYPGMPRLKLMPSVASEILGAWAQESPQEPLSSKLIIPLDAPRWAQGPVPLHACYVLQARGPRASSRVVIRRLGGRVTWKALTQGTFNLVLRDPDRLKQQFLWACRLATRTVIKSLSYPRTLQALPQVVNALATDVELPTPDHVPHRRHSPALVAVASSAG